MNCEMYLVGSPRVLRRRRRELAFEWARARAAVRRLQQKGLYGEAAIRRQSMNLAFRCWSAYRKVGAR